MILQWLNYRDGDQITGCLGLAGGGSRVEGSGYDYKRATSGIFVVWNSFIPWLYQCQYLNCDIVL